MSKAPWLKDMKDLTRYDWNTAVSVHDEHFDRARDLRVANTLMQHMHGDTGLAFPTQKTIMNWTHCTDERQVRESLYSLEGTGAITRKRMQDLQPDTLELVKKIGGRNMRAVVYKLNMFWAYETFEVYRHRLATPSPESVRKKAARMHNRSTIARNDRSTIARNIPVYDSPSNTVGDTVDTLGEAGRREHLLYGREESQSDIDPLILIPPDDPREARRWLNLICSDRSKIAWALELYAHDRLTEDIIRELAA